jgi:hypothetical protein
MSEDKIFSRKYQIQFVSIYFSPYFTFNYNRRIRIRTENDGSYQSGPKKKLIIWIWIRNTGKTCTGFSSQGTTTASTQYSFFAHHFLKVHLHHFLKTKSQKEVTKQ